ncbi:MAG: hypothetical protein ACRELU_07905 [Gemmatimonadota bacterium]
MRSRPPKTDGRACPESAWVHTSKDGRKYIVPSEVVKLDQFKEQVRGFKRLLKKEP